MCPRGHLAVSGDIFGFHNWWNATGIQWVETRDAVKSSTMCRTVPTTNNDVAQNVSSANAAKRRVRPIAVHCLELVCCFLEESRGFCVDYAQCLTWQPVDPLAGVHLSSARLEPWEK